MNKTELIEKVLKKTKTEMPKSEVTKIISSVFETITEELKRGRKVTIVGFGTFSVSKTKARKARNPQTGEMIKVKAKKIPKFKAGKALKDVVAGKKK